MTVTRHRRDGTLILIDPSYLEPYPRVRINRKRVREVAEAMRRAMGMGVKK